MALLLADNFVDTDGVLLENHTPTGPRAAGTWTRVGGAAGGIVIKNNRCRFVDVGASTLYHGPDNGTANHYIKIVVGNGGTSNVNGPYFTAVIRAKDAGSFVGFRHFDTKNQLFNWDGGPHVVQETAAGQVIGIGDTIELSSDGNIVTVKINDKIVLGPASIAGGTVGNTKSGFISRSASDDDVIRSVEMGSGKPSTSGGSVLYSDQTFSKGIARGLQRGIV